MINKTPAQIKADIKAREEELKKEMAKIQQAMLNEEIKGYIMDVFEQNYQLLSMEAGSRLTPDVKDNALKQVLLYWEKMKEVALSVTQTEVKLSLPNRKTSANTIFTIEGVVDIIREKDRLVMYDIKTHDADQVRSNLPLYQNQLNVYAYIWQKLRKQQLDQTAVIATAFPQQIKEAVAFGDEQRIQTELDRWQPLIDIPFSQENVDATIATFTKVVEAIEDGLFNPPPLTKLREKVEGSNTLFAVRVCRNCDARFSCNPYRTYAAGGNMQQKQAFSFYNDLGPDLDQSQWLTANIAEAPPDNIDDLL